MTNLSIHSKANAAVAATGVLLIGGLLYAVLDTLFAKALF